MSNGHAFRPFDIPFCLWPALGSTRDETTPPTRPPTQRNSAQSNRRAINPRMAWTPVFDQIGGVWGGAPGISARRRPQPNHLRTTNRRPPTQPGDDPENRRDNAEGGPTHLRNANDPPSGCKTQATSPLKPDHPHPRDQHFPHPRRNPPKILKTSATDRQNVRLCGCRKQHSQGTFGAVHGTTSSLQTKGSEGMAGARLRGEVRPDRTGERSGRTVFSGLSSRDCRSGTGAPFFGAAPVWAAEQWPARRSTQVIHTASKNCQTPGASSTA